MQPDSAGGAGAGRAGTLLSWVRIVPVVARAWCRAAALSGDRRPREQRSGHSTRTSPRTTSTPLPRIPDLGLLAEAVASCVAEASHRSLALRKHHLLSSARTPAVLRTEVVDVAADSDVVDGVPDVAQLDGLF